MFDGNSHMMFSDNGEREEKAKSNALSVSQISAMIQNTLSGKFSNISIKGEISGLKIAASGHAYFDLKDDKNVIHAVCWRGVASKIPFKMEDGLEVVANGSVTTYPARSYYQITVSSLKVDGVGALMKMLEERKKKFMAEGLFDESRKQPIPYMPKVIGVITSPTGAVIRDILHRLEDRFGVRVIVYPVLVQGEGAAEQIADAINFFDILDENSDIPVPDTLIVARGGGSIEDLWCFNEEVVVRAVAECDIPIISAVGHETDTTLIDYVSDKRAPTPTAAAEMAVPVLAELRAYIMDMEKRGYAAINSKINNYRSMLKAQASGLISPKQRLDNMKQRLDDLNERLDNSVNYILRSKFDRLGQSKIRPEMIDRMIVEKQKYLLSAKQLLDSYNYKNVLKRGYSITRNDAGDIIKSAEQLSDGDNITLEYSDGNKSAVIGDVLSGDVKGDSGNGSSQNKNSKPASKPKPKKKKDSNSNPNQESLF